MSSKENIHKRVFITLASKKNHESVIVAWGLWLEEKNGRMFLDGEAVVIRTKQPVFLAPALTPWTVYFMDLLSLIKEVHSLWCYSKIMWKLKICSINLAQLEIMTSYKGRMDKTQNTSISLTYRGPGVRLTHGIFCWKWNLSFFATPKCEEWRAEREDAGQQYLQQP